IINALKIDYWGETKLLSLILKNKHLINQFFKTSTFIDTAGSDPNINLNIYSSNWDQHNDCVFLSFTVSNTGGKIALIDDIYIDVHNVFKSNEFESRWIGAVMKEYNIRLELTAQAKRYQVQDINKKWYYKNGDIDGFKLKLTSQKGYLYKLSICVKWHDVESPNELKEEKTEPIVIRFPLIK
ncbi:MAG: hypothetical protein AAGA77_24955, partial [Bacteroidota bacterium]